MLIEGLRIGRVLAGRRILELLGTVSCVGLNWVLLY